MVSRESEDSEVLERVLEARLAQLTPEEHRAALAEALDLLTAKDQQVARERLAEFGRRVRIVSPRPSSGEGSEPCALPLAGTSAGNRRPAESYADGPHLPRTVTRILCGLRHPGWRAPF